MNSREQLAAALKGHRLDSMNQDSGNHCICHSDSRFEQRNGDLPWSSFEEHLADVVLNSDWFLTHRGDQAMREALVEQHARTPLQR